MAPKLPLKRGVAYQIVKSSIPSEYYEQTRSGASCLLCCTGRL